MSLNIVYNNGVAWVIKNEAKRRYLVFKESSYSIYDSDFEMNEDGLSKAIRRCEEILKIK